MWRGAKGGRSLIGPGSGHIPSGLDSGGWPVSARISAQERIPPQGPSERSFDVGVLGRLPLMPAAVRADDRAVPEWGRGISGRHLAGDPPERVSG